MVSPALSRSELFTANQLPLPGIFTEPLALIIYTRSSAARCLRPPLKSI